MNTDSSFLWYKNLKEILQELLKELIEENNPKNALKELREKNPVAYDFYNSLTTDNGKGSNDLITEGVN